MINIYKIRINILSTTLLFGLMLALQSCSNSDVVVDKNMQQSTSKNSNRRAPEGNAVGSQLSEPKSDTSLKRSDKDYDVYQNYQSNDVPVSLGELKKLKRHPVLNTRELNSTRRHKTTKTKKKAKIPHIDANCNLQEVINYNKQQQKTDSVSAASTVPAQVTTKTPEVENTSNKSVTTSAVPKVAVIAVPNKANPSTKNEVKIVSTEPKKKQEKLTPSKLPKVALSELKAIKQKSSETVSASVVKAIPATPAPASVSSVPKVLAPAVVLVPTTTAPVVKSMPTVIPVPAPVVKSDPAPAPMIKSVPTDTVTPVAVPASKSVLVPIPAATATPVVVPATKPVLAPAPLASTNLKVVPSISPPAEATKDVSDLSQADLEKMLKEKFAKNRPKEFINDTQDNAQPPVQFNKNILNENELNEDIVQSSGSSPAVSKIRAFYKESRLSKINTILISYYFQCKHKIMSLFFGDEI